MLGHKTSSDEWKTDYISLNLVCGYTEVRHEQPWHMMKMVGTKSGALEPLSSVEEVGTGVPQLTFALLDGDHRRPPTTRARPVSTGISG